MAEPTSITFISRCAPYGQHKPKLCMDMALAAAVFEQHVSYIFLEDGVFQLLRGQDAGAIHSKTLGNALETLELYGIDKVYVDRESLSRRNLKREDLIIEVEILDRIAIANLLAEADSVFNL